ncbi:excinuclease ABC subunit UvrC [Kytococcus sedentarius]|uniref:UvrABC system protein C n=1 Tax=Kytococcus sedentarius (strain ATCC 14392 / DSM 20547 / JCM 11482 / CCUG 33030 / NBRC 15357 / NCTC 11040 / CCM 314 / 541) TaxID=478801 RepID=C7NHI1_KYTSD|nr:excinuclease ABC subunit UvrC [Kytococcus sedentarius]ACV06338.1 Excinuclease ABC subunit C [Kytococcus sedentarius DSM 20547]QQB64666.1 excinuclease ABC subunit UvrC [Kytococcus sedentarius]STX12244.1 Excinuclease ABC subunit C [Kytococcus sedentarius]
MADPASYRPRPGEIPTSPGVYRFRDTHGRVIYVGKAKSLRSRLSSYFQNPAQLHPRTRQMVNTGASVEWTVVNTEVEALQLEYAWIKEFDPRFNVKYRDDKSYPYLAVTWAEEVPRAMVMRGAKRKGNRYYGPFAQAWAIRETLDLATRVFPIRTCSKGVYNRAAAAGRPCLLGYIDKCSAPCVGAVTPEQHREIVNDFCRFMSGDTAGLLRDLRGRMEQAAADLDFENAARLRDDLGALEKVLEKSAVVFNETVDADLFGIADDELEAAVQVFHVRGGRIRGQRGWVVDKEDHPTAEAIEHLLRQFYGTGDEEIPREVLVSTDPTDHEVLTEWLTSMRGSQVTIRTPERGDKATLLRTVIRNAEESLARHKMSRAGDLTARSAALAELEEALGLAEAPLRIECYDISHTQGENSVGSMVVFEDGLPRKSEYRRFIVREPADDTRAMAEVLTRRFRHGTSSPEGDDLSDGPRQGASDEAGDSTSPRPAKRFAYPPQLIVVDGGLPQVNSARAALDAAGAEDIAVVGLAKRLEEVWVPGDDFPLVLPRSSDALFLLQRLRDEAHRFAITFHRQRRSKAMTASELDTVPGLGPARRRALLEAFGTVRAIRAATPEELAAVPGIGPGLARTVQEHLSGSTAAPAVNVTTGEVLD